MSNLEHATVEAARFDDDSLAAFANKGLLRRGQRLLESAPIELVDDDGLTATGPDWTVSLASGAPLTAARCTCATAGACQHIVAVILALRDRRPGTDSAAATTTSATPVAPSITEALVAVPEDALQRWSGVAHLRWAVQRLASLDDGDVHIVETNHLLVQLPVPLPSVRFMASTLDAAIVDPGGRNDRRVVVLATLLLWRRAGRAAPSVTARSNDAPGGPDRRHAIAAAILLVKDALEQGLLHLSGAFVQRLDALAAASRGARWYRLGSLAERCADELEGLERRDASADPAVLLDLLAELSVVATATRELLDVAAPIPESLAGTARAAYEPIDALELVGCGHTNWGDALFGGSLAVLAEVGTQRLVSVSVARTVRGTSRPANLAWSGAGGVEALAGAAVRLAGARLSADLRLSNGASTTATIVPDADLAQLVASTWTGEEPPTPSRLHGRNGRRWALIAIESSDAARYDRIAQSLIWSIRTAGKDVTVELPYRSNTAASITALERLVPLAPTHVIGRLRRAAGGMRLQPISLLIDGRLEVLAASPAATAGAVDQPADVHRADSGMSESLSVAAMRLVRVAERGAHHDRRAGLDALAGQCSEHGLTVLADVLASDIDVSTRFVRAAWVLSEYQRQERVVDEPLSRGTGEGL